MVGGNGFAQYRFEILNDQTAVRANPAVGYFFTDRFVAGLGLHYASRTDRPKLGSRTFIVSSFSGTNLQLTRANQRAWGVAPFARWYYGDKALRSFIHLGLNYGRASSQIATREGAGPRIGSAALGGAVGYGVNYFVSERIALEAVLSATTGVGDPVVNTITTRIGVDVGVQILFPRRRDE